MFLCANNYTHQLLAFSLAELWAAQEIYKSWTFFVEKISLTH